MALANYLWSRNQIFCIGKLHEPDFGTSELNEFTKQVFGICKLNESAKPDFGIGALVDLDKFRKPCFGIGKKK